MAITFLCFAGVVSRTIALAEGFLDMFQYQPKPLERRRVRERTVGLERLLTPS